LRQENKDAENKKFVNTLQDADYHVAGSDDPP
jgi:hypothetical protein